MATTVIGALLAPAAAVACGTTPAPYVTLVEGLPLVRTGLPRDGAVVVRGKEWGPSGGPWSFATARLVDATGREIPSVQELWYSGAPSLALRPMSPLPARTRFAVEAQAAVAAERPAGAEGPVTMRLEFETDEGLAPPLALAGPLRVTLEPFEVPAVTCSEPLTGCAVMAGCSKQPARRALRARVVVPALTGGVDFDGYRGWLRFTDNQPGTFGPGAQSAPWSGLVNVRHWLAPGPGEEVVVLQEIIDEGRPYAPCFALQLWDPAGHSVQAPSVCLPALHAPDHLRTLEDDEAAGCSAVPGGGRGAFGLTPLLLALLALLAQRRRAC